MNKFSKVLMFCCGIFSLVMAANYVPSNGSLTGGTVFYFLTAVWGIYQSDLFNNNKEG